MRHKGFKSILENLESLHDVFDEILSKEKGLNSEVRARICGVNANTRTFDFFFFLEVGMLVCSQTDALSQTLQR